MNSSISSINLLIGCGVSSTSQLVSANTILGIVFLRLLEVRFALIESRFTSLSLVLVFSGDIDQKFQLIMAQRPIPLFDDSHDPESWLQVMEDYFEDFHILTEDYVNICIINLRGAASIWAMENELIISENWCAFCYNLLWKFAPSTKVFEENKSALVEKMIEDPLLFADGLAESEKAHETVKSDSMDELSYNASVKSVSIQSNNEEINHPQLQSIAITKSAKITSNVAQEFQPDSTMVNFQYVAQHLFDEMLATRVVNFFTVLPLDIGSIGDKASPSCIQNVDTGWTGLEFCCDILYRKILVWQHGDTQAFKMDICSAVTDSERLVNQQESLIYYGVVHCLDYGQAQEHFKYISTTMCRYGLPGNVNIYAEVFRARSHPKKMLKDVTCMLQGITGYLLKDEYISDGDSVIQNFLTQYRLLYPYVRNRCENSGTFGVLVLGAAGSSTAKFSIYRVQYGLSREGYVGHDDVQTLCCSSAHLVHVVSSWFTRGPIDYDLFNFSTSCNQQVIVRESARYRRSSTLLTNAIRQYVYILLLYLTISAAEVIADRWVLCISSTIIKQEIHQYKCFKRVLKDTIMCKFQHSHYAFSHLKVYMVQLASRRYIQSILQGCSYNYTKCLVQCSDVLHISFVILHTSGATMCPDISLVHTDDVFSLFIMGVSTLVILQADSVLYVRISTEWYTPQMGLEDMAEFAWENTQNGNDKISDTHEISSIVVHCYYVANCGYRIIVEHSSCNVILAFLCLLSESAATRVLILSTLGYSDLEDFKSPLGYVWDANRSLFNIPDETVIFKMLWGDWVEHLNVKPCLVDVESPVAVIIWSFMYRHTQLGIRNCISCCIDAATVSMLEGSRPGKHVLVLLSHGRSYPMKYNQGHVQCSQGMPVVFQLSHNIVSCTSDPCPSHTRIVTLCLEYDVQEKNYKVVMQWHMAVNERELRKEHIVQEDHDRFQVQNRLVQNLNGIINWCEMKLYMQRPQVLVWHMIYISLTLLEHRPKIPFLAAATFPTIQAIFLILSEFLEAHFCQDSERDVEHDKITSGDRIVGYLYTSYANSGFLFESASMLMEWSAIETPIIRHTGTKLPLPNQLPEASLQLFPTDPCLFHHSQSSTGSQVLIQSMGSVAGFNAGILWKKILKRYMNLNYDRLQTSEGINKPRGEITKIYRFRTIVQVLLCAGEIPMSNLRGRCQCEFAMGGNIIHVMFRLGSDKELFISEECIDNSASVRVSFGIKWCLDMGITGLNSGVLRLEYTAVHVIGKYSEGLRTVEMEKDIVKKKYASLKKKQKKRKRNEVRWTPCVASSNWQSFKDAVRGVQRTAVYDILFSSTDDSDQVVRCEMCHTVVVVDIKHVENKTPTDVNGRAMNWSYNPHYDSVVLHCAEVHLHFSSTDDSEKVLACIGENHFGELTTMDRYQHYAETYGACLYVDMWEIQCTITYTLYLISALYKLIPKVGFASAVCFGVASGQVVFDPGV